VYTFDKILNDMLSRIPDTLDKREGSIIYDALAPAAVELEKVYKEIKQSYINTNAQTAKGHWLDLKAFEVGLTRKPANFAVRKGTFTTINGEPAIIPIGCSYSTIDAEDSLIYIVTANISDGEYMLTCTTPGSVGNNYFGALQNEDDPLSPETGELEDILTSGLDEEDDDALLRRYILKVTTSPYGGNFADYKQRVLGHDNVGAVQIYPAYIGGGTVKIVVLDRKYDVPNQETIDEIQNDLCPFTLNQGAGIAPIGHNVIVKGADAYVLNITANVTLAASTSRELVQEEANYIIGEYLREIRKEWDIEREPNTASYTLKLYLSQIFVRLMNITGVRDIANLKINGSPDDIVFRQDHEVQQVPVLGGITLNG
jgi:uncharacterized phage protein gp47/JayE